jgi:hypothetical protein
LNFRSESIPILNAAPRDEVDHLHGLLLPQAMQAMHAPDALREDGRVPGQIHVDDDAGVLQVQPDAARVGGEEDPARRVFSEALDEILALLFQVELPVECGVVLPSRGRDAS